MNTSNCVINKSEEKVRKHWLFSTWFFFFLYPIALFAFFAVLSEKVYIPEDAIYEQLVYAIAGLIPIWLIWHCAYRKNGIKLLTFWLVVGPIKMLASIAEISNEPCNVWVNAFVAINIGLFIWWFLLSLEMRKVNKSIQERSR